MSMQAKTMEIRIPVPWGFIAAKSWGNPLGYPILAVHGRMDNAASFDTLAPLLPGKFLCIAIDLPGHGKSSHFPDGLPYHFMDYVASIKRVVDHFKWESLYYVGHSFGGMLGSFFAAMYPELVKRLVMLDVVKPYTYPMDVHLDTYRFNYERLFEIESKMNSVTSPTYTEDEMLGKMWGDPKNLTILAVHGLQDNASSFDRLAPLLLEPGLPFSLLAIDLPGHGRSSHFPPGRPMYFMDVVSAVYRVINWLLQHRETSQLSYIGHSFGGQIGLHIAAVFPECIEKLVILDYIGPPNFEMSNFFSRFKRAQSKLEALEKKMLETAAPTYTFEEALEKIRGRFHGNLSEEAGKLILTRNSIPLGDRVSLTLDQRLKFIVRPPFTKVQEMEVFSKITCPLLLIMAEETMKLDRVSYEARLEVFSHCSSSCDIFPVEGHHDVHLEHPERVSPLLHQFLFPIKSSL